MAKSVGMVECPMCQQLVAAHAGVIVEHKTLSGPSARRVKVRCSGSKMAAPKEPTECPECKSSPHDPRTPSCPAEKEPTEAESPDIKGAGEEARKELVSTAVQNVQYVAMGSVMKRSLAQRYNLSEEQAERLLLSICTDLCDKIARL